MTQLTALVPMRGGSVRVPGKNVRMLAGKPLFAYVIETLLQARCVGKVVVDSDSRDILAQVADRFPDVQRLERPAHLGAGTTPMNAVIRNALDQVPGEWFLQTHSTNPLLRAETVDAAWERLRTDPGADSLFSVTPLRTRFWTEKGQPVNHDPAVLLPTQDLPAMLEENSCMYLFNRATFLATGNRIGRKPVLFEMDRLEATDIDTEADWRLAEALVRARRLME